MHVIYWAVCAAVGYLFGGVSLAYTTTIAGMVISLLSILFWKN